MKLSRRVPARTKTVTALFCKKSAFTYNAAFRKIRGPSRNPMSCCFWCKSTFRDGEEFALAAFEKYGNRALCHTCADKLLESEGGEGITEQGEQE